MSKAEIANRMKEAMKMRKMKQQDLANSTGISKSMISEYCNNRYEPKQTNILKIAKALDVSPTWLMGFDVPIESIKELDKNIFVSNLNLLLAINYGNNDELFCNFSRIPKERLSILRNNTDPPTVNEIKKISEFLHINIKILMTIDLTSPDGKEFLDEWLNKKKNGFLSNNLDLENKFGDYTAKKDVIAFIWSDLQHLTLPALRRTYDYICDLSANSNNIDNITFAYENLELFKHDNQMIVETELFESLIGEVDYYRELINDLKIDDKYKEKYKNLY